MNKSALRIEWDDSNKKEIEEAKKLYMKARAEGRIIVSADNENKVIDFFRPSLKGIVIKEVELNPDQFSVRILDETGDRRLIWNAKDPEQVEEAVSLFSDYLNRGWRAYSVDKEGLRKRRIHRFDLNSQEIYFEELETEKILDNFVTSIKKAIPEPILKSEKIEKFVESFKQTKLIPKTIPG